MQTYIPITAVMVTGRCEQRIKLARRAAARWLRQLYVSRHKLLIINDHPTLSVFESKNELPDRVREIRLATRMSLGELRNVGIEEADTPYLLQWDDDDHSSFSRVVWQQENTTIGHASILRYEVHCDVLTGESFVNDGHTIRCGGFPGTMLFPRTVKARFPAIGKREDTEFVMALQSECGLQVLQNSPTFYCRCYHGENTWDRKHVMHRKPGTRDLTSQERQYVDWLVSDMRQTLGIDTSVKTA